MLLPEDVQSLASSKSAGGWEELLQTCCQPSGRSARLSADVV